jgi:hypothetical protein
MHYTTRFIDGLKPAIRMAVAIQQPHDLDSAVELALLYEELEDNSAFVSALSSPAYTPTAPRRGQPSLVRYQYVLHHHVLLKLSLLMHRRHLHWRIVGSSCVRIARPKCSVLLVARNGLVITSAGLCTAPCCTGNA